jgi:hypothetical protein
VLDQPDPGIGKFWPAYAVGLIQHGTSAILGPRAGLVKSRTNM